MMAILFSHSDRWSWTFLHAIVTLLTATLGFDSFAAGETTGPGLELEKVVKLSDQTLNWGAFRPNLYFGVRPRSPAGLTFGLSWSGLNDHRAPFWDVRYTCEQNEIDGGYGWSRYDTRLGGEQTIQDDRNNIIISTSLIKSAGSGPDGGTWAVRIAGNVSGVAAGLEDQVKTSVTLHVGSEVAGTALLAEIDPDGLVRLRGNSHKSARHSLMIQDRAGQLLPSGTVVSSQNVPSDELWTSKKILLKLLSQAVEPKARKYRSFDDLPPPHEMISLENAPGKGNLQLVQKQFSGSFEFDVFFQTDDTVETGAADLTARLDAFRTNFDARFETTLRPQAPFDKDDRYRRFSKSLLSNLAGGIGYFYGDSIVDLSDHDAYKEDGDRFWEAAEEARKSAHREISSPTELFTSIPSRPFFPRGFFWDEGFHLIPIVDWDTELVMQITRSWFNLMDEDGWIAREQILGPEARSKVPEDFQTQYPHYANPPTLFLVASLLLDKGRVERTGGGTERTDGRVASADDPKLVEAMAEDPNQFVTGPVIRQYLNELYPLLVRHYRWFRRTQAGDADTYQRNTDYPDEVYRWRGRTATHLLTSGLDDYPRAQPPHPGELHVDALSWVGFMAGHLRKLASFLELAVDEAEFGEQEDGILHNLEAVHWDKKRQMFCDATIDEYGENELVCHRGYLSLMPFMLGLLKPDDNRIRPLLELIADPDELWSRFGIRSLSIKDKFYGRGENYWREPIWLNMNYMILQALRTVGSSATASRPDATLAADLYRRLRIGLVETVFQEWTKTGFAWEQYDPTTGAGQRTQHFTGWTSLVVKILAMDPSVDVVETRIRDEL